jgi:transglutaminase/protease-like cytokinesis protein 3
MIQPPENQATYLYIVEVLVTGNGLDLGLSRRIVDFHRARHIEPRHGRTKISPKGEVFYRWGFSDWKTARAFIKRFGGTLHRREIEYRRRKATKKHLSRSVGRPKADGGNRAVVHSMRVLHAVLFEAARLSTEGSAADPYGEAVRKMAQEQNIEVETVERYCRIGRRFMKSSRAITIAEALGLRRGYIVK